MRVSSARSPLGWEVDKGWNQVLVRSAAGQGLLDLAREQGVLEFREVPQGNLEKLVAASRKKRRACLEHLVAVTGGADDLLYISEDELLCQW